MTDIIRAAMVRFSGILAVIFMMRLPKTWQDNKKSNAIIRMIRNKND